ncbi:LysR family transcriptional regulator [Paenibacillus polymyxa]|uniref:LysR family transcriptional regulator n=1 Tax=Paenibacillus polymyxa TaxID=1406 RepID=UPI002019FF93|nr:LysR family transcriptional regulator [Paenibacillus polymyxa]UQQ35736.1 LysR family transcriptional regulator [Paenibacillus polymyxa]
MIRSRASFDLSMQTFLDFRRERRKTEIRQLQYFIAVCEELHFTKASEKIGISQPTLSLQIKALEEELGMTLFDRAGKKIKMTDAGKLLLQHSAHALKGLQQAKASIEELRTEQRGSLRIGIALPELEEPLQKMLAHFHRSFPKISLHICPSFDVTEQLLDNRVDVGITLHSGTDERLVRLPLRTENYCLIVPVNHAFSNRSSIMLDELRHVPWAMQPECHPGRKLIEKCFRDREYPFATVLETNSIASILRWVQEGLAVTLQTKSLAAELDRSHFCTVPILRGAPQGQLELIYRADRYQGEAVKRLIDKIQAVLTERSN